MTHHTFFAGLAALVLLGLIGVAAGGTAVIFALLSGFATFLLMPLFRIYALARPNARSSHRVPVPQGGGVPVVCTVVVGLFWVASGALNPPILAVMGAVVLLALVGAVDDVRPRPVLPRMGAQAFAVMLAMWALPADLRIFYGSVPLLAERALLGFGCLWFVNLTNFMDGIDGITIAAFVPLLLLVSLLSWLMPGAAVGLYSSGLAMFLLAGLAGFLVFNWPPARLFLGDVGSLPIGLIVGFVLIDLAGHGAVAAALILPLYHALDSTSTLLMRLARRERVWDAHRQHAYQKAVDGGWSHLRVSAFVLVLNCLLAGLAVVSMGASLVAQIACIMIAAGLTCGLIFIFRSREAHR